MISVDTSGELLKTNSIYRIALFKAPNTHSSAAWTLELINDNHGRAAHQQTRIEARHDFMHWLTDWVDTSVKNWQAGCGMVDFVPGKGVYAKLDFFKWENPSYFKGKALAMDQQLFGVEFDTYKKLDYNGDNKEKKSWYLPIPAFFITGTAKAKRVSDFINTDAYYTDYGSIKPEALEAVYSAALGGQLSVEQLTLQLMFSIEMLANKSNIKLPALPKDFLDSIKSV